ncbi:hypothetical protein FHW36_110120 [Chitinophaga polysaccharea]|uniref:Uncharacterized protein n=1 Tax=Chitinophaga polysaccharea TaxID=1293035 RepID=A0A561PA18_9BACT|nr:hypothetical protein [Chitinophaga polysaccharea]TWF34920.1 hypothetical protein FHW36_110120 [Chitinophaga polysaccharea]
MSYLTPINERIPSPNSRSIAENIGAGSTARSLPAVTSRFTPGQPKVIQRKLAVAGEKDWTVSGEKDTLETLQNFAEMAWIEMVDVLDDEINKAAADLPAQQERHQQMTALKVTLLSSYRYFDQLAKWMDDRPRNVKGYGKHPIYGRKQQNREYNNWIEVAMALVGWVNAAPGRKQEKALANEVYQNPELDAVLTGLVHKVRLKIEALKDTHPQRYLEITKELKSNKTLIRSIKGNEKQSETLYGHYEKEMSKAADEFGHQELKVTYNTKWDILTNPGAFRLRDKVIFLHDITEYFGKHQPWNPVTAGQHLIPVDNDADAMVTTDVDATGERTATETALTKEKDKVKDKRARGMGLTTASRDEDAPSTKLARRLNLPVWAGQSMTTVRMLNMAQWAGGRPAEFNALAQAIFAFWRLEYNHTSDFAYHTLHEVMDMAKNFGVTYKTPPNPGHGQLPYDYQKINEQYIRPYVDEMLQNTTNLFQSLEGQINTNTWTSDQARRIAGNAVREITPKIPMIAGWWQNIDFTEAADTRKQALSKVLQGINLLQMDLGRLSNLIQLKSSALQVNFWV